MIGPRVKNVRQNPPARISVVGDANPSVPEAFQRRLQDFDRDLLVVWHKSPFTKDTGCWKIERCTRHYGKGFDFTGKPIHDHTCQRVYILMCRDDEGTSKPLGDWIFEKLREMRTNWEALGGDTARGIQNAIAESNRLDQELDARRERASEDAVKHNRKDKRVQINKLTHLVEQHDMRPN